MAWQQTAKVAAFGAVSVAGFARADVPCLLSVEDCGRAKIGGVLHVNMQTGERTLTRVRSRHGGSIWDNTDNAGDGFLWWGFDGKIYTDGRYGHGSLVVDWGDIAFGSAVDGFEVAYGVTGTVWNGKQFADWPNVTAADAAVQGLSAQFYFYDKDNGRNSMTSVPLFHVQLDDLPGAVFDTDGNEQINSWIVQFDFGGQVAFTLGGPNGGDVDHDGLADFAFAYRFLQNQSSDQQGRCGPLLVLPGNAGGAGTSTGVENLCSWFNTVDENTGVKSGFKSNYWFNGAPYASFYLNVFGPGPCRPDFNGDGFLDIYDFTEFVTCFEGGSCPSGKTADYNGDGFSDIYDFTDFIVDFEAGC